MSHLDPEQVALIALGEPVATPAELAHLQQCAQCAGDVDETTRVARIARSTLGDDELQDPPAHLWSNIAGELGLAERRAERPTMAPSPSPGPSPTSTPPEATRESARRRTQPRRPARLFWALAASVALIVAVSAGVWSFAVRPTVTLLADATLDAFPGHAGVTGTADVQTDRGGARTLVVALDGAEIPGTYREVWLIRSDQAALISLGILTGDRGTFAIPDGIDIGQYDLVDISAEPIDGDPAHSGDSIVRGTLTPT